MKRKESRIVMDLNVYEVLEFPQVKYSFTKEGITIMDVKNDAHLDMEDARLEYEALSRKKDELPLLVLMRAGRNMSTSTESRHFFTKGEGAKLFKAEAIISDSAAHRIMLMLINRISNLPYNIKMFKCEKEAIKWLNSVRKENIKIL